MSKVLDFLVQETTESWLNGRAIKDRLREHAKPGSKSAESRYLFETVRKKAGLYSREEKTDMVDELRSTYASPKFSKVLSGMCFERIQNNRLALDSGTSRGGSQEGGCELQVPCRQQREHH